MNELDQKMSLLLSKPLPFEDFYIYPLTVDEIQEIGFDYFYTILQIIIADETDLEHVPENVVVYPFDILISNIVYCSDQLFLDAIFSFFKKVFRKEYVKLEDDYMLVGDDIILHIHNYGTFVEIIKQQYCVRKEIKKPRTEKQKEMDRLRSEKRKKYAKWIEDESEDISDLISSVLSVHPTISDSNIGEKTLYYLVDQFKRINKRDDYFIGIKSLLAGASKEDVKLIHWTKKIVT